MKNKYFYLPILFLLLLLSCSDLDKTQSQKITEQKNDSVTVGKNESVATIVDFQIDSLIDQNATVLAGLNFAAIKDTATILTIAKLNKIWEKKTQNILEPIQHWMKRDSSVKKINQPKLMFYPFSGPDFEFANTFYPEADKYILCGLEPAGNENALIFSNPISADSFLRRAEEYFFYSSRFGFFRTLDMEKQFQQSGVADVIAFYLKRSGVQIGKVALYHWGNGKLNAPDSSNLANTCYFKFRYPSGKVSELYYFSKDLSNGGLTSDSTWFNWVKQQAIDKQIVSLTKSASYLMHSSHFTLIRNFILENSQLHIQDDSGIKYEDMQKSGRTVLLYGTYQRVIPIFNYNFQATLKEAYIADSLRNKNLPFKIGYNLKFGETNLQVMQ